MNAARSSTPPREKPKAFVVRPRSAIVGPPLRRAVIAMVTSRADLLSSIAEVTLPG